MVVDVYRDVAEGGDFAGERGEGVVVLGFVGCACGHCEDSSEEGRKRRRRWRWGLVSSMFFGAQRLRRCSGATPDLSNCSAWVSVIAERIWEAAIVAEAAVETRS